MPQVGAPDLATIAAELRQIEQTAHNLLALVEPRALPSRRAERSEPEFDGGD